MNKKYAGLDFPAWFDGKDINEAAFCREFLSKNKLIYADNAFFTSDGRLTDPLLLKEKIYAELECCAAKNIPRTISNIVEIMKLAAHTESFPPKQDEIHVQNGTLRIDGSFLAGRAEIVRSRFPIAYNPQAGKPVVWLRFLSDLLYPEDIPTFQEYIGYCLVPSTKGQRMMILKGEGGEGKSQIGPVLARLFGCNMKDGSIAKISDNRFARADLEHIHLLVDDDMKMDALKQTNYVKSIVTAQGKMDLERKSVQSYQGWMYARLLAFSNGDLQSLYDRSNCYPDAIYTAVRHFYSDQDKSYPLGKTAIFQQLSIDGLIETDKAQNTKAKRIGNKRPRLLWLKASALNREEGNENE